MLVYKNHRDYSAIQTSNFEWVNPPPLPPPKKPKTEAVNTFSQIDEYLQVTTNIQNNVYWTDWITTNMKNCWTIFYTPHFIKGNTKEMQHQMSCENTVYYTVLSMSQLLD